MRLLCSNYLIFLFVSFYSLLALAQANTSLILYWTERTQIEKTLVADYENCTIIFNPTQQDIDKCDTNPSDYACLSRDVNTYYVTSNSVDSRSPLLPIQIAFLTGDALCGDNGEFAVPADSNAIVYSSEGNGPDGKYLYYARYRDNEGVERYYDMIHLANAN